uniref:Beta-catenin-like protein 1 n=1 Tax=Poecilia latipinna TaxID=48699 RepID=A0A3B3VGM3_9TELE
NVNLNVVLLQPDRGAKRPRGEDGGAAGGDDNSRGGKQQKGVGPREAARFREVGGGGEGGAEPVDESSVKKMILTFEKRSYKNQELRIKFPDNPEKFMESELDLNDIIQEMHVIATMPDLYHLLVELNAVHSLLGLLSHENTDILLNTVVDLLQELTDIDTLHESEEGAEVLIDALVSSKLTSVFIDHSTLTGSILKFLCFGSKLDREKLMTWSLLVNTK